MCRKATITTGMVTPTKVKHHHQKGPHHHHQHPRGGAGGGGNKGGWTTPPNKLRGANTSSPMQHHGKAQSPQPLMSIKTGQQSPVQHQLSSGSSTPNRGSPCFAGSKCFEPPPESLPKPPTSWKVTSSYPTKVPSSKKQLFAAPCSASQESATDEAANRHLRMLLNVQA